MKRVVVIGGGAAGLMAAVIAGREGAKVTLLEKMNYVGKKMGITGKGRCNITNACDMSDFIKNTPGNGKFLYGAYERFTNEDLLQLLHDAGLNQGRARRPRISSFRFRSGCAKYLYEAYETLWCRCSS